MTKELAKSYSPKEVEDKIYDFWLKGNYFHAEVDKNKKPYTIVMPPPNITGQLHMGHALDETFQDILIRFRRMQGYAALWLPGTDHASIATEAKIVEAMRADGITKKDIGRDKFLERAWEWKKEYGGIITEQLKKLGCSCDWERERFTMDEGCSKAVKEVFIRLYNKGLIYRGERIINWCPHCKTSISDAEVDFSEKDGHFWHLRYPLTDGSGFVELATTRPETLLGDTAVAVHPEDDRYKSIIGKTVTLPLVGREIPIVADTYVEQDFGTGVVKITPAHDPNDFEVGLRHNLPIINVMDDGAVMNKEAGKYEGLDRYESRKAIVKDLEELGFLVKTEDHKHNVGSCYRCKTVVEPRVSKQWFVKMKPLAEPAIECVKTGETKFIPTRFEKVYFHWMENIKDWCISRQLWWGHRIPAWYCEDCGEVIVSKETPTACTKCSSTHLHQDEDTLDTWFSSALWPFSTLGWPDKTPELEYFYPTNTLVTAYDIIFFWVARMIFSGCEQMVKAPFSTVFMHGIVRDENGQKMSKSLGNGIDPLTIIDHSGADALRLFLTMGNSPGNDMRFSEKRVESCSNFANKLWNAARFVHMNTDAYNVKNELPKPEHLLTEDKWILSIFNEVTKEVTNNLDKFELGIAVQKVHDFIWDYYCDWYIELAKARLQADGESAQNARQVLIWVLDQSLRLLHPFMPYITEEIWQTLPHSGETIMLSKYPSYVENNNYPQEYTETQQTLEILGVNLSYPQESAEMESIRNAIKAIRNRRAEMNVPPSRKAKVFIATEKAATYINGAQFICRLASASEVEVGASFDLPGAVTIVTSDAQIYIPMDELVDKEAELTRLNKELQATQKLLAQSEGKLNNQGFIAKAPQTVVDTVKQQAEKEREKIALIIAAIEAL
ncbi:valine--tRNA ligase [Clostridia bacterium]|nr:valine--tRNA ligase [Clostridia bacterium]